MFNTKENKIKSKLAVPGIQGPKGDKGERGEKGDKGERGERGPQGLQGPKGDKGQDGTMTFADLTEEQKESLRGPKGDKGEQGIQGLNGLPGEKGEKGEKGDKGDKGDPGSLKRTTLYSGDTRSIALNTEQTLSQPISNFDFIYVKYYSSVGINTTVQYIDVSEYEGSNLTLASYNITDSSPYKLEFYEHTANLSKTSNTFTIAKRNKVTIDPSDPSTIATEIDNKNIGIKKIIGIKLS